MSSIKEQWTNTYHEEICKLVEQGHESRLGRVSLLCGILEPVWPRAKSHEEVLRAFIANEVSKQPDVMSVFLSLLPKEAAGLPQAQMLRVRYPQ